MASSQLNVAIIGGGLAGLNALHYLLKKPEKFNVTLYEKSSHIGGQWVYTEIDEKDPHGKNVHSSVYSNLCTNVPVQTMAFVDFPFQHNISYLKHQEMRQYIEDFADYFKLKDHITFNMAVRNVKPVPKPKGGGTQWKVEVQSAEEFDTVTKLYDAVIVCNGHEFDYRMPDISGLDNFHGKVIHSHVYRHPEDFQGQTVLMLGSSFSSQDIGMDVSQCAKKVYLSHWRPEPMPSPLPDNMEQTADVAKIQGSIVMLTDGTRLSPDVIIVCVGYQYRFDFLAPECNIRVKDSRVTPLYKHCINIDHSTMCFVGITKNATPSPTYAAQMQFITAALEGSMSLPSKKKMLADTEADFKMRQEKGWPVRHSHYLYTIQQQYYDELAALAKFPRIPPYIEELFNETIITREMNLMTYKNKKYIVVDANTYKNV